MLKSIDSTPLSPQFPHQQPAATRLRSHHTTQRYLTYYTALSLQPKTKYIAHSFQCVTCWLLAPCKGIVENNSRSTKDIGDWRPRVSVNRTGIIITGLLIQAFFIIRS